MRHFDTLSAMRRELGMSPPEPPQLYLGCPRYREAFSTDCYGVMFKRLKAGVMLYGRTPYDHTNGSLSFVKPRQRIEFRNLEVEKDSFLLFWHEDYLHGHPKSPLHWGLTIRLIFQDSLRKKSDLARSGLKSNSFSQLVG